MTAPEVNVRLRRIHRQPVQLHEFQAEREDPIQRAVQARLVQVADERRIGAVGFDQEVSECFAPNLTQTASDRDPVTVRAHVPPKDTTDQELCGEILRRMCVNDNICLKRYLAMAECTIRGPLRAVHRAVDTPPAVTPRR